MIDDGDVSTGECDLSRHGESDSTVTTGDDDTFAVL